MVAEQTPSPGTDPAPAPPESGATAPAAEVSAAHLRRTLDAVPDGIIVVDSRGTIQFANRALGVMTGYAPERLRGQPIEVLLPERFRGVHVAYRTAYTVQPRQREMGAGLALWVLRRDGTEVPVEISLSPLADERGELQVLASVRDVTERRRAQVLLERQAALLNLARDAIFVRELAGPITFWNRAAEQLYGWTEADAVLDDVLTDLSLAITESAAEIVREPLPTVRADAIDLRQLLQNLVGNALKYQGTDPPRRHVSAQPEGDHWRFSVQDNGIGIEPGHAERVFQPFQRLHAAKDYPGTGIGLAVCQKIVDRHGGRIWVESQPGQGSRFSFTLPGVHPGAPAAPGHRGPATGEARSG